MCRLQNQTILVASMFSVYVLPSGLGTTQSSCRKCIPRHLVCLSNKLLSFWADTPLPHFQTSFLLQKLSACVEDTQCLRPWLSWVLGVEMHHTALPGGQLESSFLWMCSYSHSPSSASEHRPDSGIFNKRRDGDSKLPPVWFSSCHRLIRK